MSWPSQIIAGASRRAAATVRRRIYEACRRQPSRGVLRRGGNGGVGPWFHSATGVVFARSQRNPAAARGSAAVGAEQAHLRTAEFLELAQDTPGGGNRSAKRVCARNPLRPSSLLCGEARCVCQRPDINVFDIYRKSHNLKVFKFTSWLGGIGVVI